ncbi:MAG: hypothetical protein ABR548_01580 [Actinomycetota bacterium]|nr:hypothetical protein [Actinomycetota bacterium]
MQLLLGYAFDRDSDPGSAERGVRRVEEHYEKLWLEPFGRHGVEDGRVGLFLWDTATPRQRWDSWQEEGDLKVATLYLPLGYEGVVGKLPPETAAPPLAKALVDRPWSVMEMTPPFVVASLHRGRGNLRLHTDGAGLGRLFELRFPGGWVWSNRPAALFRFAGLRAEHDRDGWRTFAATGWFLGERTPIAKAYVVPGGTTIRFRTGDLGRDESRVDCLGAWANHGGNPLTADRIAETADALQSQFTSLARMWPGKVVADLSGGRDSRLVLAAALAAGLDLDVQTNGAQAGEADVAEQLVAALPTSIASRMRHAVHRPNVTPESSGPMLGGGEVVPNILAWHRCQEGLRPSTYLPTHAPDGLTPAEHITVGGAAGEIAHGHYYPKAYAQLGRLPWNERLDAFASSLARLVVRKPGVSTEAQATATQNVRRVLEEGFARGVDDARVLDYFYAAERIRRWGTAAERTGTLTPLLTPRFIESAFDLSPEQRRENALHRALTAHLIPEWKDAPYYERPRDLVLPALAPKLGRASDKETISLIMQSSATWSDAFDGIAVEDCWKRLQADSGTQDDERLLQRVCWHAVFEDFLAEVNGESMPPRTRAEIAAPPPARKLAAFRRVAAKALRK